MPLPPFGLQRVHRGDVCSGGGEVVASVFAAHPFCLTRQLLGRDSVPLGICLRTSACERGRQLLMYDRRASSVHLVSVELTHGSPAPPAHPQFCSIA